MGTTPDRAPGPSEEEELQLEDRTADGNPTVDGAIRFVGDDFVGKTSTGVKSLTAAAGGGITESEHEGLDTQVHALAETRETVVTRSAGRVTEVLERTTDPTPKNIRKTEITRSAGRVSQVLIRQYDGDGNELTARRMTGAINRTGASVSSIDWTEGT